MSRDTSSPTFRTDASMYPVYCVKDRAHFGSPLFIAGEKYGVIAETNDYRSIIGEKGEVFKISRDSEDDALFESVDKVIYVPDGKLTDMVMAVRPLTVDEYDMLYEDGPDGILESSDWNWLETTVESPEVDRERIAAGDEPQGLCGYTASPTGIGFEAVEQGEINAVRPCLILDKRWKQGLCEGIEPGTVVDIKGTPFIYAGENEESRDILIMSDILRNPDRSEVFTPFTWKDPVDEYRKSSLKQFLDERLSYITPIKPEVVYCVQKCTDNENWAMTYVSLDRALEYANGYLENMLGAGNGIDLDKTKEEVEEAAEVIGTTDPYESMGEHPTYSLVYDSWIELKDGVAFGVISVPLAEAFFNEPYKLSEIVDLNEKEKAEER